MKEMKRPPKCCKPDCFNCPYVDCRYDGMDAEDYSETNNRDYELYKDDTGRCLHRPEDKLYKSARQVAYRRANPEYLRQYYINHRGRILAKRKSEYETDKNTATCKRWREKNKDKKRAYDRKRYLRRKETANGTEREKAI